MLIKKFADQSQFNQIRDALWKQSVSATVMVGSGFSRNADRAQESGILAPTWRDLSEAMHRKLYPQDEDEGNKAVSIASLDTSGALRLAQEYETAFGRTELHSFLRSHVQDELMNPGNMHRRLLQLPWRDVFTTNWDTLLERAGSSILERSYGILRNMDEIPLTASPRIVKLHGSFDGRFPLIFTEEDYRTYPNKFAPFVNTVQQAMMESVFCLLGFSGDDPNFLHWSGWVRDNLGSAAPKIYLAGWLGLSLHRRRMLETRNVIPIDLAQHPKADEWPSACRHEWAMDWILHSLELGRPYVAANWPSPSNYQTTTVPKYLRPVQKIRNLEPKSEPTNFSSKKKLAFVQELLNVWTHNRIETYPGWLVAPMVVRSMMWTTREYAKDILDVVHEFQLVERLYALRELIWRWEIQLEPISHIESVSSKLEREALDVLTRIDCLQHRIEGEIAVDVSWPRVREAWITVGLYLVTAARLRCDEAEFKKRLSALSPFQEENGNVCHRIRHERCLWAIYSLDFESLQTQIEEWNVKSDGPVWNMRKAAILFEIGEIEKAKELNDIALKQSQKGSRDKEDFGMLSREAWALFCAGATMDFEEFWYAKMEWQQRWDELTPFKCNSLLELQHYREAIKGESRPERGPPFDLERVGGNRITFSQDESNRWVAAHRAVRLAEVVGLPPNAGDKDIASNILELAARQIVWHEPELAMRIVLRAVQNGTSDTLNYVFSRAHIALMFAESTQRIVQICLDAIDYILPRIHMLDATSRQLSNRLSVVLESLSRFLLRLQPEQVSDIFRRAMDLYKSDLVSKNMFLFADPMMNLLKRSWESLPIEFKRKSILDLFSAPIVGLDGFSVEINQSSQYPDPCYVLKGKVDFGNVRTSTNDQRWKEVVGFIARALWSGGEARRRASNRLNLLIEFKILMDDEIVELGRALWGEDYKEHCDLPVGTNIFDWAFILRPQPRPGLAEERFRLKWLNTENSSELVQTQLEEIFWNIGAAIRFLEYRRFEFRLSDKERNYIAELIDIWARKPIPIPLGYDSNMPQFFAGRSDEDLRKAISGLQIFLLRIDIPKETAEKLFEKCNKLNQSNFPAQQLSVGLVRIMPERLEDIVQSLRMGLASDDTDKAKNAVDALGWWLQTESAVLPPTDLVREVGVIIAIRRKAALQQALQVAKWIIENGKVEQRNAIHSLVVSGLGYLLEELRYENAHDENIDIARVRHACTELAITMAENSEFVEPIVANWVENLRNDPMIGIKRSTHATYSRCMTSKD